MIRSSFVLSAAAIAIPISIAAAQGAANNHQLRYSEQHGMTFSEIGDPGAPGTVGLIPGPQTRFDVIGSVNQRYRIATTEVTVAQYTEFVVAVAPHIESLGGNAGTLAGRSLQYLGMSGGVPQYQLPAGTENHAARANFGYYALMANWLHNGAPSVTEATIDDFRTGAYDDVVEQPTRNEGARFWIPSRDEWIKAAHYDPNRHGPGQGGYWLYPDASDDPLIPGAPDMGGETSAGNNDEWPNGHVHPRDVGSYPDMQSPWGLLDVSGSNAEWTETLSNPTQLTRTRFVEGTQGELTPFDIGSPVLGDYLYTQAWQQGSLFAGNYFSVRFAAAAPAPGAASLFALSALLAARRRR